MVNLKKKIKIGNNYDRFCFETINEERIKLLMKVIRDYNLNGKKCSLSVDSFNGHSAFFSNFIDGSGVVPISIEKKK
jgi:hypothetical protein